MSSEAPAVCYDVALAMYVLLTCVSKNLAVIGLLDWLGMPGLKKLFPCSMINCTYVQRWRKVTAYLSACVVVPDRADRVIWDSYSSFRWTGAFTHLAIRFQGMFIFSGRCLGLRGTCQESSTLWIRRVFITTSLWGSNDLPCEFIQLQRSYWITPTRCAVVI
jgi:hypothetical protein